MGFSDYIGYGSDFVTSPRCDLHDRVRVLSRHFPARRPMRVRNVEQRGANSQGLSPAGMKEAHGSPARGFRQAVGSDCYIAVTSPFITDPPLYRPAPGPVRKDKAHGLA